MLRIGGTLPLVIGLGVAACGGQGGQGGSSPASWLVAEDIVAVTPVGSTGIAPLIVTIRTENRFGASVSGPAQQVTVGSEVHQVPLEPSGYGSLSTPNLGTTTIEAGGQSVAVHSFEQGWPGMGWHHAWTFDADATTDLGAAGTGSVVAAGNRVWWVGPGLEAHPVLALTEPVRGVRTGAFDGDDTHDAVAWTDTTAFLLKGRRAGGMSYWGAISASGASLAAVDMGDLSGDNQPDLALLWIDGEDAILDVWEASGETFVPGHAQTLDSVGSDVVIGDATGEGAAQLTVLHRSGQDWSRFLRSPGGDYIAIGPRLPAVEESISAGSTLLPIGDVNGDGGAEVTIVEPRISGNPRAAFVFDLLAADSVPYVPLRGADATHLASGDGNGDGLADVWILDEDGQLEGLFWHRATDEYRRVEVRQLPGAGPLHAADINLDGAAELAMATSRTVRRWWGTRFRGDPDRFWQPRAVSGTHVRESVLPLFVATQLDADPSTIEVVTFAHEEGNTHLKVVRYTPGEGRAPQLVRLPVFPGEVQPDDLVLCDDQAWFALGGRVFRVELSQPNSVTIDMSLGDEVTRVDCGSGPDGADAVALNGTSARLLSAAGQWIGSPSLDGARDVAIGDLGAGPEVRACQSPGCSITYWRFGETGASFVVSDADGTRLSTLEEEVVLNPYAGRVSLTDVNGDGLTDLVGLDEDSQLVWVHRATKNGIADVEMVHSERGIVGVVGSADGDADGWPDLWSVGPDGDLRHSVAGP